MRKITQSCSMDSCDGMYHAKGLCKPHYQARWFQNHPRDPIRSAQHQRKFRQSPKGKIYARRHQIRNHYKVSRDEAERLMSIKYCEITGDPPGRTQLHVDHTTHKGKIKVRGVLSGRANVALGHLKTPDELLAAADYLVLHGYVGEDNKQWGWGPRCL